MNIFKSMKFSKAIVRKPCRKMVNGLTTANLGVPDYSLAIDQHQQYIRALELSGLEVTVLAEDEQLPDSVFIEDTALLTPHCAVVTNPGAYSRIGEIKSIVPVVSEFYDKIEYIKAPGKLEAGDVMMVGNHYYIGISERTNPEGAKQLATILKKYGMTASTIMLKNVLHLKTGLSYLENNNLVVAGEFSDHTEFSRFNILKVDPDEAYAANCVWINDVVLIPSGYPKTKNLIESAGYKTIEIDVSEFRKLDGGLSCLSLRF